MYDIRHTEKAQRRFCFSNAYFQRPQGPEIVAHSDHLPGGGGVGRGDQKAQYCPMKVAV